MGLIHTIQHKFERLAISNLIRIVVGLQGLVYVLSIINPNLYIKLLFDRELILRGEVWRLFSYILIPPGGFGITQDNELVAVNSPFLVLIAMLFAVFLGDVLEQAWGSIRVNCYVLGMLVAYIVASFIWPGISITGRGGFGGFLFYSMLLLPVSVLVPDQVIRLMFVIPVKMKWLGLFNGALLCLQALNGLSFTLKLLLMVSPFLIAFGPGLVRHLRNREQVASRRRQYQANSIPEGDSLHRCATCGRTEADDSDLEFRVAADDEEYCQEHLP